jgi:glycosyltransferase involved in cell wall biosynthesis/SAM-dependent methyltransferase
MRILQLTSSYPLPCGGGLHADSTAPFVRSIARALADRGHELRVLAPERSGAPRQTVEPGIVVDWLPYAPHVSLRVIGHAQSLKNDNRVRPEAFAALPLYLCAMLKAGRRICREWNPQAIHAHWVIPNAPVGAMLAREFNLPLVINLHGSDVYLALKSLAYGQVARWTLRQAVAVIAPSQALYDGAVRLGADPSRVYVCPHGVDSQRFQPLDALPVPGQPLVVMCAGRLVPKKGIDVLLRAAPDILRAVPMAEIWVVGDGDYRPVLEAQRDALPAPLAGRIRFLGQVDWDQMPAMLRRAAVFAAPSVRDSAGNEDGLPTILLEAMACGCPVVASHIAGIPLVIRDNENGLLLPPGDAEALGRAVVDLLKDPQCRARLGSAGRALVEREFTWAAATSQLETSLTARPVPGRKDSTGAQSGRLFDFDGRRRKGSKIWRALEPSLRAPAGELRLLDVGCSAGVITNVLAEQFRTSMGIDIHAAGLAQAITHGGRALFAMASSSAMPFADHFFDAIVCAQVYEHVSNQQLLADEIYRVLKPGGIVFFSGPNRLAIIEDHYGLPFLSWLSLPLANAYLRVTGKGNCYEENPLTLNQLMTLWRRFDVEDLTITMIQQPGVFGLEREMRGVRWISAIPRPILALLRPFFPNFNWLLRKRTEPLSTTEYRRPA